MPIELDVTANYEMFIFYCNKEKEIGSNLEKIVLDRLKQGDYAISMNDKTIIDVDTNSVMYKFKLDPFYTDYEYS